MATTKNLLLIFTRNPELGKGKRRLAATVGDEAALEIYRFLLRHTVKVTQNLLVDKRVYYSEKIADDDVWNTDYYTKKLQQGADLGARMTAAFLEGFGDGYENICIIGSDLFDLEQSDIEGAFTTFNDHDFVVGPAEDGGYYLLGMKKWKPVLFEKKDWGMNTVLSATLSDLKEEKVHLLPVKNDVDTFGDIKDVAAFKPFLRHL